jgi:uncharacterized membrane protein YkvA (DUF1232 family)
MDAIKQRDRVINMKFSEDKAKSQFESDSDNISQQDIENAAKRGRKKLNHLESDIPGLLKKIWKDINLMASLIADYSSGRYTDVPWRAITAITAAMLYFISPIDLIPDFIFGLGYLDDVYIIKLALDFAADDLQRYANWKERNVNSNSY